MITFIVNLIVLLVLLVGLVIVAYFLRGVWRTILKFFWISKWEGIQKKIRTTACEIEPQVRALVERKVKEHSLVLKGLLTCDEYEERYYSARLIGHSFVTGWVCTVSKDDERTTRAIEVWIVLRSKWGVEGGLPPNSDWSVADQFVFDVNSPHPGSIGIETTDSLSVAEIEPIIERIFDKYGI